MTWYDLCDVSTGEEVGRESDVPRSQARQYPIHYLGPELESSLL